MLARQAILFTCFAAFALAAVSFDLEDYREPAFLGLQFSLTFFLYTAAAQCPPSARILGHLGHLLRRAAALPRTVYLGALCLGFLTLAWYFSSTLFHHLPHVNDTINQYIAGKFLLHGRWSWPAHPLQEFFHTGWMINDHGRLYTPYSPAPIVLMAIGHLVHMPWLINPLMGALTVFAAYCLARDLYGESVARLAALLTCLSPFIVFMSSEYMNHAVALLCTTLFMFYFIRTVRRHRYRDALLTGTFLGLLALARPFTALGICIPFAFAGIWLTATDFRLHAPRFLAAFAVFAVCLILHGLYDLATTGDFFTPPYYKLFGDLGMPGLGHAWDGTTHTSADILVYLTVRLDQMSHALFEWPVTSFVFVLVLLLSGRMRPADYWLLPVFPSLLLTYAFFHGGIGPVFGPRYVYESSTALIILTAAALCRLPAILRANLQLRARLPALQGATAALLAVILIAAAFTRWPAIYNTYATHYYDGNTDYYRYVSTHAEPPALVFTYWNEYPYVAFENPFTDRSPVIYAWNRTTQNPRLMRYYPYRNTYAMNGRGLLEPVATPYTLCPAADNRCDRAIQSLRETYGIESLPACATETDRNIEGIIMPTNILLQQSLCRPLWTQRFRRLAQ